MIATVSAREVMSKALPGLLADWQIARLCDPAEDQPMISPFVGSMIRYRREKKVISYGLGSSGYDIRLSPFGLYVCDIDKDVVIDPLGDTSAAFSPAEVLQNENGRYVKLLPNQMMLGHSIERFAMPSDVLGLANGKSTYARSGVHVLVTPLEAGWRGELVVEVANVTPLPVMVYVSMGICQILFFMTSSAPDTDYGQRDGGGKYQDQSGTTFARA